MQTQGSIPKNSDRSTPKTDTNNTNNNRQNTTMDPELQERLFKQSNERFSFRSKKLNSVHGYYVKVMVLLGILQVIGIAFFTRGFLLSRQVLPDQSTCLDQQGSETCLKPAPFEKYVILLIDALRFDFAIPVEGSEEPYHNNFPLLHDLFINHPENSLLLKFIADPPTTTLQRLKGLTTGSLPTIIDAGSNFDGDTIEEDNWISQLHHNKKNVAFVGDDTWDALFSPFLYRNLTFPYDSLNVWDLHSVDNGVIEHLFPMLTDQSLKNDWDVLIGHFLGVDHCGHRYGPQHFAMKQKLNQMNKVVQDVIDSLDDDTMLIVFGDHGMDPVGNHGGESVDEIESTIFMYSKTPYFGRLDDSVYDITNAGKNYRKINQIDLVPTMSFLLGMPIPFNSLGSPIDEVFLGLNNNNYEQLAKLDHITSGQIQSFRQKTPSLANNEEINDMFSELSNEWLKTISNNNNNEIEKTDAFKEYILKSRKYQSVSLEECKNLWARFDLLSISIGIIITFVALLLLIIYSKLIPSVVVAQLNPQFLSSTVALLFVYGIIFASFCNVIKPEGLPLTWGLLLATAIAIVNGILAPVMNRFSVPWLIAQVQENLIQNGWTYFALVIILLHSVIFTSNSFIIWEDKIVTFWLSTFGFCAVFKSFQKKGMADKLIGVYHSSIFIILTRLASTIRYCREEQGDKCQSNFNFSFWSVGLLYITAYLLPLIINYFYKITSSYEGAASLWISKTLRSLMFLIAIMWTLEYVEQDSFINENYSIPHDSLKSIRITIARIVIGAALIAGTIGWSMGPLCIRLDVTKPEATETTDSSSGNTNNSAKSSISASSPSPPSSPTSSPTPSSAPANTQGTLNIIGYRNAYGSTYFLFVINVLAAILLVNKPLGGLSLFLLTNQILTFFELVDLLDIRSNLISVVVMGLLGYSHFFTTGHQATLAAIHWETGFLLTETILFPITHIAIILETFGSFIIVYLSIPLLTLWKIPPNNKPIALISKIVENATSLMIYQLCLTLSTLIMTAHFRRHLMVWKIFAPRFMLNAMLVILMNIILTFISVGFVSSRVIKHWYQIFGM